MWPYLIAWIVFVAGFFFFNRVNTLAHQRGNRALEGISMLIMLVFVVLAVIALIVITSMALG